MGDSCFQYLLVLGVDIRDLKNPFFSCNNY